MNAADVLIKASEIVEKGWCRGEMQHGDRFCALGALRQASMGDANNVIPGHPEYLAYMAARNSLEKILHSGDNFYSITGYNDYYAKSRHDVINLMQFTAGLLLAGADLG